MERQSSKIQKRNKNVADVQAIEVETRNDKKLKVKPAIAIGAAKLAKKEEKPKLVAAKKGKASKSKAKTTKAKKSKAKSTKSKTKAKKSKSRR